MSNETSNDEKMAKIMEKHAAKATPPPVASEHRAEKPEPIADMVGVWEMDDRDATLICPKCANQRTGKVLKSWWMLAEKRGDTNPWWKMVCTPCAQAEQDVLSKRTQPKRPNVSEALELELPTEER